MDDIRELVTEQRNVLSDGIDRKTPLEILGIINKEDQKVPNIIEQHLPEIEKVVKAVVNSLSNKGRLFYVGAGTSGRIGILDASECPPTYGTPPEMVQALIAGGKGAVFQAVEGAEDNEEVGKKDIDDASLKQEDIVIGITASGRAPYVIGALREARKQGVTTVSFTCNKKAKLNDYGDYLLNIEVGPEVVMGSTRMKAGTAQKLVLNMITTTSMIQLGKVYGNLMVDLQPLNQKLVQRCLRIIEHGTGCTEAEASDLFDKALGNPKVAIIMRQCNVSRETALQMLEEKEDFIYLAVEEHNARKQAR